MNGDLRGERVIVYVVIGKFGVIGRFVDVLCVDL